MMQVQDLYHQNRHVVSRKPGTNVSPSYLQFARGECSRSEGVIAGDSGCYLPPNPVDSLYLFSHSILHVIASLENVS